MKIRSLLSIQIIILLLLTGCLTHKQEISINDLRCENLSDPLGISTTLPRLSWKIKSGRNGTSQKAYQILAASDAGLLDEKNADLWNSGKVVSSETILVPYKGKELTSRSICYWKVRLWDESDIVTEWSSVSFFSIGLLNKPDWKAAYIGLPDNQGDSVCPQLRKTFNIADTGEKTFLQVNSLGYHEVYLNGKKVGDKVLTPAVVQFNKRSQVLTYDISPLIKKGKNDLVIWIGKGWYSKGLPGVVDGGPFVRAQIDQLNGSGWNTIVSTDSSWTGRNSGYYNTGSWRPNRFGGERVVGSLMLPDMSGVSLDKASWMPVSVADIPEHEVTPQMTESNAIKDTIKPENIKSISKDVWLIDMGTTLTGWFDICFHSLNPGQDIKMDYSDHLDKDGNFADQLQTDHYIASGEKNESFRNKFNYHGFRYIKISNLVSEPKREDINAFLIHTDYNLASSFECSDPDLNNIHNMLFYTLRCLSLGGYLVDCTTLERLGYGGDGNASTETAQTMFDLDPLYNNWLQAWADCIREDGGMPHTAPNPYPAGGGPYWCGFIITASWKTFINYGDTRVLEKYYPVMQQWLGYVDKYSPSGLLQPWPDTDYRGWFLGDWASPAGTDHTAKASIDLVNNCFITICYETMQKIASVLGKTSDIKMYSQKKEHMKQLINSKLFNSATDIYGSGTQIDLTYPLLAGIVPDSLIPAVKKNLYNEIENNHSGHIACGLVGIPVFTEWVTKNHEADLMYSILKKRDYPGYLYMLDNGATTTWEHWNGERSRIHNCYNGIGSWFYQALGGIRTDEVIPGYRHFIIDPQVPQGITWSNASKETPYGTVSVKWKSDNGVFSMNVKIPVGCTAKVTIPDNVQTYKLNGNSFKKEKPYKEIESGEYSFIF
ncbi:MAG TPA: family 78 glycoside hydrolase catalytic domain [Bacteroidales bacterium]|nr:family 78 glycoside hydrolase catalytic domain [Bacteroidales bacterium]